MKAKKQKQVLTDAALSVEVLGVLGAEVSPSEDLPLQPQLAELPAGAPSAQEKPAVHKPGARPLVSKGLVNLVIQLAHKDEGEIDARFEELRTLLNLRAQAETDAAKHRQTFAVMMLLGQEFSEFFS